MTQITATSILSSRNCSQSYEPPVLHTLLLRYPRFIHAELMTHRVFSRNAASSRAIKVSKMIESIIDDPVVPLFWGKNQPGMQAREECIEKVFLHGTWMSREEAWLASMKDAINTAKAYNAAGYHKQVINRLLEPYAHITVLVSATEWDNWDELRDHEAAEPHIQMLAKAIKKARSEARVHNLSGGEWHLPFIDIEEKKKYQHSELVKLSVARCASTSYKTVDGFDMSLERATKIYENLAGSTPKHLSPFEHLAQADVFWHDKYTWDRPLEHKNFYGFKQYRAMIE